MNKCAVKGCKDVGRSHICLWDGRYHGHGRIHYDGGAGQKDAKIAGLTYRKGDWYLMCNAHYEALKLAREQRTEHCFIKERGKNE